MAKSFLGGIVRSISGLWPYCHWTARFRFLGPSQYPEEKRIPKNMWGRTLLGILADMLPNLGYYSIIDIVSPDSRARWRFRVSGGTEG
jgi:hypothetical protein